MILEYISTFFGSDWFRFILFLMSIASALLWIGRKDRRHAYSNPDGQIISGTLSNTALAAFYLLGMVEIYSFESLVVASRIAVLTILVHQISSHSYYYWRLTVIRKAKQNGQDH